MLHLGSMLDYLKDNSDSIRPHMEMALWYLIFIFFKSMKNKLVRGKNILDSSPGIVLSSLRGQAQSCHYHLLRNYLF